MVISVVIGLVAAVILKAVYVLVRISWPENYFDSTERNSEWFYDHPARVMLWRLVPYVLAVLIVLAVENSRSVGGHIALLTLLLAHVLSTNVWAIVASAAMGKRFQRQIAYGVVLFAVLLVVTWALSAGREIIRPILPQLEDVTSGFWAAIFVAMGFAGFRMLTKVPSETRRELMGGLHIDAYYLGKAVKESARYNIDPLLLISILEVEARNRPKLHRTVELLIFRARLGSASAIGRRWGKMQSARTGVLNPGTLGIGQADIRGSLVGKYERSEPVSLASVDLESIEKVAQALIGCQPERGRTRLSVFEVKAIANRLNNSREFGNSLADTYDLLCDRYSPMVWIENVSEQPEVDPSVGDTHENVATIRAPWMVRFDDDLLLVLNLGSGCAVYATVSCLEAKVVVNQDRIDLKQEKCAIKIVNAAAMGDEFQVSVFDARGDRINFRLAGSRQGDVLFSDSVIH